MNEPRDGGRAPWPLWLYGALTVQPLVFAAHTTDTYVLVGLVLVVCLVLLLALGSRAAWVVAVVVQAGLVLSLPFDPPPWWACASNTVALLLLLWPRTLRFVWSRSR